LHEKSLDKKILWPFDYKMHKDKMHIKAKLEHTDDSPMKKTHKNEL